MVADTNVRVVDLPLKNAVVNDDTVVSVVNGVASRVKISTIKSTVSQWSDLQNKPFDVLDSNYFVVGTGNALTASQGLANSLHTHSNKIYLDKISEDGSGHITYNGESVVPDIDWDDVINKPFDDLSNDFVITSGTLSISTDIKHTHENKTVIDKFSEVDGHLLYDGSEIVGGGIDFSALADAMTTGTLTGITITADTIDENFDITVTGMPTIAIDSNGYWTIDGVSTGHQSKGDNGITPSIDSTTKHWMIGSTDTQVVAEGQNGTSPTVSFSPITGGNRMTVVDATGTSTVDIMDGVITTTKVDLTCTALAANWVGASAPYTQTISVAGLTSSLNPVIDVVISSTVLTGLEEQKQWGYITKATTGTNSITLSCYKDKPTIDLNIIIEVV